MRRCTSRPPPNPSGKSLANRQRFLRRAKALVRKAVQESLGQRAASRTSTRAARSRSRRRRARAAPSRRAAQGGMRDHVLPGNKEYLEGDTHPAPAGRRRRARREGSRTARARTTSASCCRARNSSICSWKISNCRTWRSGARRRAKRPAPARRLFALPGSPANLASPRTMRNSLSRRIALKRPRKPTRSKRSSATRSRPPAPDGGGQSRRLRGGARRASSAAPRMIPYIDPLDVRYRRFEPQPKPVAQAVMFCLMDVSGSMTEHMKDLAKRFYMLLHLFLTRRYQHVEVVFIRHTHQAQEVDEETFFHCRETGGTVVSTALEEMPRIVAERYPADDGTSMRRRRRTATTPRPTTTRPRRCCRTSILPVCQYYAYLEVGRAGRDVRASSPRRQHLWRTYEPIATPRRADGDAQGAPPAATSIPVFRELFERQARRPPRRSAELAA